MTTDDLLTPNERELAERYRRSYPWLGESGPPCQYDAHRPSDRRLSDEHPWVCGICHPPAVDSLARVRRTDPTKERRSETETLEPARLFRR